MKLLILSIHRHDFYAILILNTPSLEINHMEQTPGLWAPPPPTPIASMQNPQLQPAPNHLHVPAWHGARSQGCCGMGGPPLLSPLCLGAGCGTWHPEPSRQVPRGKQGPDSRDHPPAGPVDCPPACASPPGKWATPRISLSPWWRSLPPAAQPNPGPTQ